MSSTISISKNPVVGEIEFVEFIDHGHRLFVLDGVCRDVTACLTTDLSGQRTSFGLSFCDDCEAAVVVGVRQLAVIGDVQFEINVIISGVYALQEDFHCFVCNSILGHDEIPAASGLIHILRFLVTLRLESAFYLLLVVNAKRAKTPALAPMASAR